MGTILSKSQSILQTWDPPTEQLGAGIGCGWYGCRGTLVRDCRGYLVCMPNWARVVTGWLGVPGYQMVVTTVGTCNFDARALNAGGMWAVNEGAECETLQWGLGCGRGR